MENQTNTANSTNSTNSTISTTSTGGTGQADYTDGGTVTDNGTGVTGGTGTAGGKKKKTVFYDLGLILALLLAALLAWAFLRPAGGSAAEGAVVRVQMEGREDEYYPLSQDGVYALNGGTNTLVIEDGWAWMSDADCPDKLCILQGRIQKNGQWIICLPNRVAVTIEGGEDAAWDEILG